MDSIRKKVDYYTHTIWGRWVCNALVALCAFVAMKEMLEYGLTLKHSFLQDFFYNQEIEAETFTNYTPIIVAVASFLLPGVAPVASGVLLFATSFAVCPYLISLAALVLMFAAPANKIIKALATLMPIAVMQFTAEQMDKLGVTNSLLTFGFGICLIFIIAYASHIADKVPYAMSTPILFLALAVPAGFFGKFKHISFMKSYWLADKTAGYFEEGIDKYPLDHLQTLLIILVVLLVVMVVFTTLLTTKKTALAKMSRDKRDAIVFAITTVLLVGALVGLKAGLKLETMEINYVMIVVQMVIAFIATRFITMHDESLNVADEEKLKKFSKFTSILAILAIVAGIGFGGYYYWQHKDDVKPVGETMEDAIVAGYDASNDTHDVYPAPVIRAEAESIWYKFVTKEDTGNRRRCVVVFDNCEEGKVVKDATLYDETGEKEICDVIWWEDNYQSEPFPARKDQVFYLKVDLKEHPAGDYLSIHSWTE